SSGLGTAAERRARRKRGTWRRSRDAALHHPAAPAPLQPLPVEPMVMASPETGIQRAESKRDEPQQAPHRHAQAEELPVGAAAVAGGQQDLARRAQPGMLRDQAGQARKSGA